MSTEPSLLARSRRHPERGNATLLAVIVLTALATLGAFTVMSVQSGTVTDESDRFHMLAAYAAESGGAVTMDFLRHNVNSTTGWSTYVTANNVNVQSPAVAGNDVVDGATGNFLSADTRGWYHVEILNNRDDPGFAAGLDRDTRVIIRAVGHGPNGALAVLEWDVSGQAAIGNGRPCPGYAQRGISEDGAGRNDCLTTITKTDVTTYRPGGL